MIKKTVEFELKYQEAAKNADELGKIVQKQDKEIAKLQGTIDKNFDDIAKSSKSTAKGVKGIGNALKAAGIGLAIAAFAKLTEVFNQNQKVTDAFNTTFEVLSLAFNDFFNFLDANVGTVINYFKGIFENPVQSIKNFGQALVDNIIERVKSSLDALGYLGEAVVKVFSGDFAGAAESAKNAGKELIDVVTGVNNTFDKVAEITPTIVDGIKNYAKSTFEAAKGTVDLNKQAELAAVINQGLIEKYDRQAEQQRQLRDDETKTIEERIAANNKLGEILEEQQKLMLENVDITIRAAQAEYNKNQNQENAIALQQAQNERAAVLAQIEGFRSEQIINRISLEKEAADLKKEADDAEKERLEELAEKKAEIEEANRQQIYATLDAAIDAAGQETKIGKALFIAKQAMLIKEQIAQAKATLQELGLIAAKSSADIASGAASTAKVGFPQNVPLLIAFAGQAAGIISSVKSAVSAAKGQASSMGGSGGGGSVSAPQAPSFNIVGAAPENQLAQTLGEREDKPMKAYVVSNEVSNAQALDRNIIEGASIG